MCETQVQYFLSVSTERKIKMSKNETVHRDKEFMSHKCQRYL